MVPLLWALQPMPRVFFVLSGRRKEKKWNEMTGNESCEIHAETGPMGNSVGMFGHLVSFCLLNLWHCGSCVYAARCCPDGFPYLCSWSFFSREV
jgi:hypothetical protein